LSCYRPHNSIQLRAPKTLSWHCESAHICQHNRPVTILNCFCLFSGTHIWQ